MFGSDRNRPKDYRRAVIIVTGPKNTTKEDTLRSERRSALKKSLTEPTLLEEMTTEGEQEGLNESVVSLNHTQPKVRLRVEDGDARAVFRSTRTSVRQLIEPTPTQDHRNALFRPRCSGYCLLRR
jgi:hypothetical protein